MTTIIIINCPTKFNTYRFVFELQLFRVHLIWLLINILKSH